MALLFIIVAIILYILNISAHSDFSYLHPLLVAVIGIQIVVISLILSSLIIISQLIGRYQTPNATDSVINDNDIRMPIFVYGLCIVIEILTLIFIDVLNSGDHDYPLCLDILYALIIIITFYVFWSFHKLIRHIIKYTNVKNTLNRLTSNLNETIISKNKDDKDNDFYIQQILDILSKSILNHESSTFFHGLNQLQKELFKPFCQYKDPNANEDNKSKRVSNNITTAELENLEKDNLYSFFNLLFQNSKKELSNERDPTLDLAPIQREEINSLFIFVLNDCCSMSVESKYERGFIIIIEILTIHVQAIINLEKKLEPNDQKDNGSSQKLSNIIYRDSLIFLDLAYRNAYSKKLETALVAIGWGFFYLFYQFIDNGIENSDNILPKLNYYLDSWDQEKFYSIYPQYSFILTYICISLYERSTGISGNKQLDDNFSQQLEEVMITLKRLKERTMEHGGNIENDLYIVDFCIEIIKTINDPDSKIDYNFNKKFILMLGEILRFIRINLGTEYLSYANLLTYQANYCFINGDYLTAEGQLIRAKEILLKKYGENINYAASVGHLARLYTDWGRIKLAKENCKIATTIHYKEYGQCHKAIAAILSSYVSIFRLDFNNDLALKIMDTALKIREYAFNGRNNHLYAAGCLYASFLNIELGNFKLAFQYVNEGSEIRYEICSSSLSTIRSMLRAMHLKKYGENLKKIPALKLKGDTLSEIKKIDVEIKLRKKLYFGKKFPSLSIICSMLKAIHLNEYGEYLKKHPDSKSKDEIFEEIKKIDAKISFDYSSCFNSALNCCDKELNSFEKSSSRENLDYLSILLIKTKILYNLEDFDEAEKLCSDAIKIKPEGLNEYHPSYILPLQNLTRICYACKKFETGLINIIEAFQLAKKFYKEDSIYYIASLLNLANALYIYGLYSKNNGLDPKEGPLGEAKEKYIEILDLSFKYGPVNGLHCLYMGTVLNLSRLYLDFGDRIKGLELYNNKISVNINDLRCLYGSESESFNSELKNYNVFLSINKNSVNIKFIDLIKLVKKGTKSDYLNLHCFYDELINQYKKMQNNDDKTQKIDYSKKYEMLYYYKFKVELLATDHLPTQNYFFSLATYF